MDVAADYLSGGEQQMVAVARAMSGNVKLLLLDEPFEGLAPTVILELFKVFDRLRQHISIVIVEHNLDLVLALADRVFALERGAVFHRGPGAAAADRSRIPEEDLVAVTLTTSLRAKRSNPSVPVPRHGSLRFARNDGAHWVPGMSRRGVLVTPSRDRSEASRDRRRIDNTAGRRARDKARSAAPLPGAG